MDKPRIYAKEMDVIATAEQTLKSFEAGYRILEKTDIRTSIGNIFVIEVTKAGNGLIAGPSSVLSMQKIIKILSKYKLDKILIDGAFFRHSLAKLSDATVVVIGANYNQDLYKTVEDAKQIITKFHLKRPSFDIDFLDEIDRICMFDETGVINIFDFDTTIGFAEKILEDAKEKYGFLYLPKSLTNEFVELIVKNREYFELNILVDSPVSIQLNFNNAKNLFKLKNKVYVKNPVNVVAVCYNPYSPVGYEFDDDAFRNELEKALGLQVFNVEKE